ncbi:MAG: orotate phosphoribosyltransferase, partial [Aggregatilineales bacterium]
MTDSQERLIAHTLLEIDAVGFSVEQPVTFKSGLVSPVYVDNRRLPFYPQAWQTVITAFSAQVQTLNVTPDVIAGVAVGGVPHSSALAYQIAQPSVFIRKAAKEHGKQQRVEGGDVMDKNVLLVEDLITTGGSSLSGVMALRESGAMVTDVLAIVSYGFDEAVQAFAEAAVNLHTLTNFTVILEEALTMQKFTPETLAIIQDW